MLRWLLSLAVVTLAVASVVSQDAADLAASRKQSEKALRTLVIGMHNYHNDFNRMPAHAIYDKANKTPLLSWRVTLLPYLGHEVLFKKFKLDEPWDSENNKALLQEMPDIYQPPGLKSEPGKTCYQVFTMPYLTNSRPGLGTYTPIFPLTNSRLTLGQLTVQDGTSMTICIAEAAEPVEWTKPSDLLMNEKDDAPLPKLGFRTGDDVFQVAFADASVYRIRKAIPDMKQYDLILKSMIGRRDGYSRDTNAVLVK